MQSCNSRSICFWHNSNLCSVASSYVALLAVQHFGATVMGSNASLSLIERPFCVLVSAFCMHCAVQLPGKTRALSSQTAMLITRILVSRRTLTSLLLALEKRNLCGRAIHVLSVFGMIPTCAVLLVMLHCSPCSTLAPL
jgi:hypothetical protein